jgi:hypothetical protein
MSFGQAFHDWMSDGAVAWRGLVLSLATGVAYVAAGARTSPRGRRWPAHRTAAFVAGLLVMTVALDSGVAAHDDVRSVHMFQHAPLMMLAPMLLALGATVALALRTFRGDGRARLLAVLHDPSVRRVTSRPPALIADYNVTMAIVLLAPDLSLAERFLVIHIAIHVYLIVCGLLVWTVVLARDPIPGRLAPAAAEDARTRLHPAQPAPGSSARRGAGMVRRRQRPRGAGRSRHPGDRDAGNQRRRQRSRGGETAWFADTGGHRGEAPIRHSVKDGALTDACRRPGE